MWGSGLTPAARVSASLETRDSVPGQGHLPIHPLGSGGDLPEPGRLSAFLEEMADTPTPSHNSALEEGETSDLQPALHIVSMHFRKMGLGLFAQVNYLHWESGPGEKLSPIH